MGSKPEKDPFMIGLQKELAAMGLGVQYTRQAMWVGKETNWVHQLRVNGLVCRCMYVTFDADKKELHVSDQMHFAYSSKDWQFQLVNPASNPQLIVDFFRDLKAVGDKYGRTIPVPQPEPAKEKAPPVAMIAKQAGAVILNKLV